VTPASRRPRPAGRALVAGGVALAAVVLVAGALLGGLIVGGGRLPWIGRGAPAQVIGPPRFVDQTATSGVSHVFSPVADIGVGGGVAAFDCSGDGKPDLYLAGGSGPAALFRNESVAGRPLRFAAVDDTATEVADVMGAYPLDVDGDGIADLAVLRFGGVDLLRGLGDCRFERANERWSFDGGSGWTTAFSATWEGSDRLPTIALGRYLRRDAHGPATYACDDNSLLRPRADGSGYLAPAPLTPGYCALSMLFSDWDGSGRRDLRVSNDRHYYDFVNGEEQLFRIAPGEAPRAYTASDGWVQMQLWGMGIASADLTGDGHPEVYLTNQGPNRLQTLTTGPSAPTYRDIGLKLNANAGFPYAGDTTLPSTAWHPEFADVNDDGLLDLFVSKGNVGEQADYAIRDPSDLLLGQPDGRFVEAAGVAGLTEFAPGRGAALVDLDLDGRLDLVEAKVGSPALIWRNLGTDGTVGHWLSVSVRQAGPNVDAIGGWLDVRVDGAVRSREITIGGGHAGGQLGWLHVGLGAADRADVRVRWPDGETGPWLSVAADEFAIVDRGASEARRWQPPNP
jgi:hypothetical protein